jgi:hypothetical protein
VISFNIDPHSPSLILPRCKVITRALALSWRCPCHKIGKVGGPMKSIRTVEKLTTMDWGCGKRKLLVLEEGCSRSLFNRGGLISLSSLIPSYSSHSSRGRRWDDEGCVRSISTFGDSSRGAGSSLRSCPCTTACDYTSSSLGSLLLKLMSEVPPYLKWIPPMFFNEQNVS